MIIDTHVHIMSKAVQENRSAFFDGEPEFKLLYDSPKSRIVSAEDVIETMDKNEINTCVVCGFPWHNPDTARTNNDTVIEAVARYPGRIKGLACFDAVWDGAADETRRCIDAGLSGAGELAFYLSGIDDTALSYLEPVMEVLKEKDMPCMIHTNEPVGHMYPGKTPITLEQIYRLAGKFPDNKIILAHWGGGIFFYHLMKKEAKTILKNIWYDTAASPFLYDATVYDAAACAGVIDKVLLGTDFPLLAVPRYQKDLAESGLTPEEKQMVLGDNAAALYRQK